MRFALVCLLLCSCASTEESGLERVRREGVLLWGGDIQGGEPYVFDDPHSPGALVGFEVDLANAIAREIGVRAEFVQQDWSNLVPSLERSSFDVIINGLEVTSARAERVHFTRPYFVFAAQLVARRDDLTVRDMDSLSGRRVGTLANSFSWEQLQGTDVHIVSYEGVEEPYADLEHGRIDAVLLDDIIASRYGLVRTSLRLVTEVSEGHYAIAVRNDDEDLHRAIDQALGRIVENGELRAILARWNIDSERQSQLAHLRAVSAATNPRERAAFSLHHVQLFLEGAVVTLLVSAFSMALAMTLGLFLALGRMYGPRIARLFTTTYVEIFRGTPVLLQLYVLYFGIMPSVRTLIGSRAGIEYDAFVAAVLGLGLNYAAYEAEIYRAGILAVPNGQMEAARVLGMSTPLALRRVIVPQAFRIALPGVTNDFIALLKDSSLVSVITVVELTKRMTITAVELRDWFIPGLLCAALYMAMSLPLSHLARRLEDKLGRTP